MRFFSLGKIRMNQIRMSKVINDQENEKTHELKYAWCNYFRTFLKLHMSEHRTSEIHRSQGPCVGLFNVTSTEH